MRVACRWPGGMDLAVMRGSAPPIVIHVAGPSGEPPVLPPATKEPPSRYVATQLHKKVADYVKIMQDTSHFSQDAMAYGVTEISEVFWNDWLAQNSTFDVVTHKMVFAL